MSANQKRSEPKFGVLLTLALAVPVVVAVGAWCVQWLLRFPPRSPGMFLTALALGVGWMAEIFPVPIAIARLIMYPSLRTRRNVVLTIVATLFLLPGIALYIGVSAS